MDVLTYTDARARLKAVMDQVSADRSPVLVTRQNGEAIVMVTLSDWRVMEETAHLLSSPVNTERLQRSTASPYARPGIGSIAELDAGRGVERALAQT